jgi:hypothetical protein
MSKDTIIRPPARIGIGAISPRTLRCVVEAVRPSGQFSRQLLALF